MVRLVRRASPLLRSLPQRLLYSPDRARRYGPGPRLLSTLRRWRLLALHPHADIRFAGPVFVGPGTVLHIPGPGRLVVGPGVEFRRGFRAEIEAGGSIEIGANTIFTYDVLLQCTTSIQVGERCTFGQSTLVVDGQHRFRDVSRPTLEQGYDFVPVVIGDGALITTKCSIMASVGERAIIGANSVVTRDIPAFTVAVGAPARVIDEFGPAD